MNKSEIKQKRVELVRVILEIEKLKVRKAALTKALAPDFEANEAEYRSGVKTDACSSAAPAGATRPSPSWRPPRVRLPLGRGSRYLRPEGQATLGPRVRLHFGGGSGDPPPPNANCRMGGDEDEE